MLLVIARETYKFYYLACRLVGQRLPQASHHAGNKRRRERGTVVIDDGTAPCYHRCRTAVRHDIWLNPPVGSRSYGTERCIHTKLGNTAHGKDVACICGEIDSLPTAHTLVSGRIDTDDTLVGTHGGGTRDKGGKSVLLAVGMVGLGIVKAVIPQRRVDDIHSHTVGILGSLGPVVFFGKALRTFVLTPHQKIFRLRGRTHIIIRSIGSHRRQHHRAVVHLLEHIVGLGNHEVLDTSQTDIVQRLYLVGIHKAAVEHSYHHSLATKALVVQGFTVQGMNLRLGGSVLLTLHLYGLRSLAQTAAPALADTVGRREHFQATVYKGEAVEFFQFLFLVYAHQKGIVPLAAPHHFNAGFLYRLDVSRSHRQVGTVHSKSLSSAPLYGAQRQKVLRFVDGIGAVGCILILQIKAVHEGFAARIGYHFRGSLCRLRAEKNE